MGSVGEGSVGQGSVREGRGGVGRGGCWREWEGEGMGAAGGATLNKIAK